MSRFYISSLTRRGENTSCYGAVDKFNRHFKPAFTLVELLVVISIISLLISVLLPALQGARKASQRAICGSNERQIGIALSIYTNSYKDQLPLTDDHYRTGSYSGTKTWPVIMATELGSGVIIDTNGNVKVNQTGHLSCPSMTTIPTGYNTANYVDYGMNRYGIGGSNSFTSQPAYRRLIDVKYPSSQIGFADARYAEGAYVASLGYFYVHPFYKNPDSNGVYHSSVHLRHQNSANALYVDGHVKAVTASILVEPTYQANFIKAPWGNP